MKFTIRKAEVKDGAEIADVKVDSWRETYTGLMPDEILSKLSKPKTQKVWEKIIADGEETDHTIVAEVDGKIVGFLNGGAAREPEYGYKGELCAVYLLEEFLSYGSTTAPITRMSAPHFFLDHYRKYKAQAVVCLR